MEVFSIAFHFLSSFSGRMNSPVFPWFFVLLIIQIFLFSFHRGQCTLNQRIITPNRSQFGCSKENLHNTRHNVYSRNFLYRKNVFSKYFIYLVHLGGFQFAQKLSRFILRHPKNGIVQLDIQMVKDPFQIAFLTMNHFCNFHLILRIGLRRIIL